MHQLELADADILAADRAVIVGIVLRMVMRDILVPRDQARAFAVSMDALSVTGISRRNGTSCQAARNRRSAHCRSPRAHR